MGHGPEQHIEHAEHAAHAAHDDFNKMVTMSIAIVAAVLACVTMLSHQAHNETLLLQGEALRIQGEALRTQAEALELQTQASRKSTEATNQWAYYQKINLFNFESTITLDMLSVLTVDPDKKDKLKKVEGRYKAYVDKYEKRLKPEEEKGHEMVRESNALMDKSKVKLAEVDAKMEKSREKIHESDHAHHKAARFDYGELGLQFGVVLCSLAILTKSRGFWFAGLASSLLGALVAGSGFFIGHH